jgi:hypothetical protein
VSILPIRHPCQGVFVEFFFVSHADAARQVAFCERQSAAPSILARPASRDADRGWQNAEAPGSVILAWDQVWDRAIGSNLTL